MSETNESPATDWPLQAMRTCLIIQASMITGVLTFLLLALFVLPKPVQPAAGIPITALLSIVLAIVGVPLGSLISRLQRQGAIDELLASKLDLEASAADQNYPAFHQVVKQFQTQMIIRLALFEGAAFLAIVSYIGSGHRLGLIVAGGMVLLMLARLNLPTRIQSWLIDTVREASDRRAMQAARR